MIAGLCDAETKYFRAIGRNNVNINEALKMNQFYSEKLFELYRTLSDKEERLEIECEINYLIGQAKVLRKLKKNEGNQNE